MRSEAHEKRRRRRVHLRRAAWIRVDLNSKPLPCVLWDQSETGARIAAPHANKLPAVFTLVHDKQSSRLCRVVWRKGPLLGVQFTATDDADQILATVRHNPHEEGPIKPVPGNIALLPLPMNDSAIRREISTSHIAAGLLCTLIAMTIFLYFAGYENRLQIPWAVGVCQQAHGMCQHADLLGGASVLMALIFFTTKGMEL